MSPRTLRLPGRPRPPATLGTEDSALAFVPDPTLAAWLHATFIGDGAALHNPDHAHLRDARLGVCWTNAPAARHGRTIVGQAEIPRPQGSPWAVARQECQLVAWFGEPAVDFLLTLHAPTLAMVDDATFCAVLEHELYHCGQARDALGIPRFRRNGRPAYALRGHDVEEFVGVVARYGLGATPADVRALAEAAAHRPTVGAAAIARACGTCLAMVA